MKKLFFFFSLCCVLVGAGCAPKDSNLRTITYMNDEAVFYTEQIAVGETVDLEKKTFPEGNPKQEETDSFRYIFSGWGYSPNGDKLSLLQVSKDVTLHALYTTESKTPDEMEYTVTFLAETDEGEKVISEQKIRSGGTVTPPEAPARTGYTFSHWDKDTTAPITGRTEFRAVYEKNCYTLYRHVLGEVLEETVEYEGSVNLTAPTLSAAFRFEGWYSDEAFNLNFELNKMPAADVHMYGKCAVKFDQAHLILPENAVYGGENTVCVGGLPKADGLTYSYLWQDGSQGEAFHIENAGETQFSVTITANYTSEDFSLQNDTTLTGAATVAKRPLELTLSVESVEYGTMPVPELTAEGYLGEQLLPNFVYTSETGESATMPFSAGRYTVTVDLSELENYEFTPPTASFEVTKKLLTVSATAADVVYGTSPAPELNFEGFILGDDESVLTIGSDVFLYDVGLERLTAGEHAVSVRIGAFSAQNYELAAGEPSSFTVEKASIEVNVFLDKTELIYGEKPNATLSHTAFAYPDETDETVLGGELEAEYSAETFPVGSYTATPNVESELENYHVTKNTVEFTVSPKPVSVTIAPIETTFGNELSLPEPTIEGLIAGEESLKSELLEKLSYSLAEEEREINRFLPAGSYTVKVTFEGELTNYTVSCSDSSILVDKRDFSISSGQVSRNRDTRWSYTPSFTGEEEELFHAEGLLILDTADAGTYNATEESMLSENHYVWSTPLKISLLSGEDVTASFEISYALSVTLNNSRFTVTVPTSGLTFLYDAKEHRFAVEVTPDAEEEIVPTVRYTVNGSEGEPVVRDAGRYEILCEISAENYETETRTYTVTVEKAEYSLSGTKSNYTAPYNGETHGEALVLHGAEGDDVSGDLTVTTRYSPYVGEQENYSWNTLPLEAGVYEITYSAEGNPNYEELSGSFTVTIERISYTVTSEDQDYTYASGQAFGRGVSVEAIDGNAYTVTYTWNGGSGTAVPTFSEAVPGGAEIQYIVSEGVNYEEKRGSYTVTVRKAKGELDVSKVKTSYVYNGAEQRVEGGATSNNHEDEQITYEDNTFTTVREGAGLVITVRLAEGRNYTGDTKTVSGITVDKLTYLSLPVDSPRVEEQYNKTGKTLADVSLPQDFYWKEKSAVPELGNHGYEAFYDPDSENINAFALTVSFSCRKERVIAKITGGEADFGAESMEYANFSLTGEDGRLLGGEERAYVTLHADAQHVDSSRGGTYSVACHLELTENGYFEITDGTEKVVPFKLKSVEADGALYTVEDALSRLTLGTAKVLHDTDFIRSETIEALGTNPYESDGYRTVKKGVTLLVPCKDGDDGTTAQKQKLTQSNVIGSGYATLTLENGELIIEGSLIVNALRSSDGMRTSMVVGSNFGCLELKEGATVRVKDGGTFESMGFSYGEGEIFAESGSKVFEPFAMPGWKGGAISSAIRNNVFPINQYALSSLIAKTHFEAGASYGLRASVSATLSLLGGEQNIDLALTFLGDETAFVELKEGEILKKVRESDGKALFEANGDITFHNLEMQLSSSIKFNTKGLQVPLPGNLWFALKEGSTAKIPSSVALKLLPGASVAVDEGAELTLENGGAVYGYGEGNYTIDGLENWQDGGNGLAYPHKSLSGAYLKSVLDFGYTEKTPAVLRIDGKLTTESGSTLAAQLTGSGTLEIKEGTNLQAVIEEDKTPAITSNLDKIGALSGKGGQYFSTTFKAYFKDSQLTAGTHDLGGE